MVGFFNLLVIGIDWSRINWWWWMGIVNLRIGKIFLCGGIIIVKLLSYLVFVLKWMGYFGDCWFVGGCGRIVVNYGGIW